MGSALDLRTAYREGAWCASPQPFLGYLFMLEECEGSTRPVKVREPHFSVFSEFVDASYMRRYELFCRKLVMERHYSSAAFITSEQQEGIHGHYRIPAEDLSIEQFARSCFAQLLEYELVSGVGFRHNCQQMVIDGKIYNEFEKSPVTYYVPATR